MALIRLSSRVPKEDGSAASGLRVRAYGVQADGTRNAVHTAETTTDANGEWEFVNLNTAASDLGFFDVEIYNESTGQRRWRYGDEELQIGTFVGANGEAPIADNSITAAKIQSSAVTDTKIGNRSVSDAAAPSTSGTITSTLSVLLGYIANRIKAITGESRWNATPLTNLRAVKAHMDDTSIHGGGGVTGDFVEDAGSVPSIRSGTAKPSVGSGTGQLFVDYSGSDKGIYRWSGSTWVQVANVSDGTGTTGSDASTINGNDADLYPYIGNIDAEGEPSNSTGPWKIAAGTQVVSHTGGGRYSIPLGVTVNGYATAIIMDGSYSSHVGTAWTVTPYAMNTGSGATIIAQVIDVDNNLVQLGNIRLNYFVIYW